MALIALETVPDGSLAAIIRGRLAAAGIEAFVFDDGIASLIGPGLSGVRLMVEEDDRDAARAVLDDPQ